MVTSFRRLYTRPEGAQILQTFVLLLDDPEKFILNCTSESPPGLDTLMRSTTSARPKNARSSYVASWRVSRKMKRRAGDR